MLGMSFSQWLDNGPLLIASLYSISVGEFARIEIIRSYFDGVILGVLL